MLIIGDKINNEILLVLTSSHRSKLLSMEQRDVPRLMEEESQLVMNIKAEEISSIEKLKKFKIFFTKTTTLEQLENNGKIYRYCVGAPDANRDEVDRDEVDRDEVDRDEVDRDDVDRDDVWLNTLYQGFIVNIQNVIKSIDLFLHITKYDSETTKMSLSDEINVFNKLYSSIDPNRLKAEDRNSHVTWLKYLEQKVLNKQNGLNSLTVNKHLLNDEEKEKNKLECINMEDTEDRFEDIASGFVNALFDQFELWCKAYSLNNIYRKCYDDPEIVSFSHRLVGWQAPDLSMPTKLNVKLLTNFGYGSSSYFYVQLIYRDFIITPFADIIKYRFARTNQIIGHSKRLLIKNDEWKEAYEYIVEAYNLFVADEELFVKRYVFDEVVKLGNDIESIFNKTEFEYIDIDTGEILTKVIKKGSVLIEFRAEKLVSSLRFLPQFREICSTFKNLPSYDIEYVINKMTDFSKMISPQIDKESFLLESEIKEINSSIKELVPRINEINDAQYSNNGLTVIPHGITAEEESLIEEFTEFKRDRARLTDLFNKLQRHGKFIKNYLKTQVQFN